ncbi:MAG: response regulator receiver protein [Thermoleophilia bacterium]|nr:response regulator receiver protein [Thermoleophilia bacterium]
MPPPTDMTCKVAICDDVADFRRVVGLLLETAPDMQVVGEAGNGREAIELVQAVDIDVLLLDVSMPVMDGMEALPHLVAASPETSIVMMTGFGSMTKRREADALGATGWIEKGTSPNAMVEAIRAACAACDDA